MPRGDKGAVSLNLADMLLLDGTPLGRYLKKGLSYLKVLQKTHGETELKVLLFGAKKFIESFFYNVHFPGTSISANR